MAAESPCSGDGEAELTRRGKDKPHGELELVDGAVEREGVRVQTAHGRGGETVTMEGACGWAD